MSGIYSADVEFKGVNLMRFSAEYSYLANATINPDNIGFCTPDADHCLDTGVVNISSCQMRKFSALFCLSVMQELHFNII